MKKLLLTLLTIFMLVPLIGTLNIEEVKALGQSEMACGAFEVDYINDDGSFSKVECYDDLASAKAKMKENNDYVVRHTKSLSYTKIVAMNSGIAYSYPRWGATLNIYQNLYDTSKYYKSTYVSRHYELDYVDTSLVSVGSKGYAYGMIEVNVMGFYGYCDLENTDLVPSKFINNGISISLGGNNSYSGEGFFRIVPKQNYFEVNSDKELVFHMYYGYGTNGTAESYSFTIGKASEKMSANTRYYSYDGYNFYTNSDFTGTCITYYNYYQFLPLRSKTNVTADMLNRYIADKGYSSYALGNSGQYFIDAQEKYGINALILFSMAIHESGFGTSGYATKRNNLFGWSAYDGDPSSASYFNSVYDCVQEQAGINLRGYVDITDGRFFSSSLGNKGSGLNVKYASDPYWGMKIASYCYAIDKNYNNSNDINTYSLSLINTFDIDVKASASDSSNTLYTTQYGPYYQENFIVITLAQSGDYTKIQSTNPIDDNGNIKTHRTPITTGNLNPISYGEYDFDKSVGYVKTAYLTSINTGKNDTPSEDPDTPSVEKTTRIYVDSVSLSDAALTFKGFGFIQGINFDDLDIVSHSLIVKNIADLETVKTYKATTSKYDGIYMNDGYTYTYAGFEVSVPLSDISEGEYYFELAISNGDTTMNSLIYSYLDDFALLNTSLNAYNYRLKENSVYNYRFELSIESLPSEIDYSSINKPSTRDSMFSFNSFTIDEDGNLYISGDAMIYYLDYPSDSSAKYTVYIVDDSNNYKKIECNTLKTSVDYASALNSTYNMDYISFETKGTNNISDLSSGYYTLILKVENGNYVDYFEMSNPALIDLPSSGNYRFFTSSTIRDRIMLQITD